MNVSMQARRSPRRWLIALLAIGAAASLSPSTAAAGENPGALYTQTNATPSNEIVVYERAADGTIAEVDRVATGGAGSAVNPPFDQAHLDSQGAVELTQSGRLLFAVNAGSDTVSSFRVGPKGGLTLVDVESSNGAHPISVDSHHGLLYVLNAFSGNISGLTYDPKGEMTPLAGSSEPLSTPGGDGLASQVGFNRHGTVLTVTLRLTDVIDTFAVGADGTPGPANANPSNAPIPFAFAYDNRDNLVVANAGPFGVFTGSGSTYDLSGTTLTALDNELTGEIATCWVVITENGRYALMTNTGSGGVSRFALAPDGSLTLLGTTPTSQPPPAGPSDAALSGNSRYLYVLNVFREDGATVDAYRVKSDGSLEHLGETTGLPVGATGLASK